MGACCTSSGKQIELNNTNNKPTSQQKNNHANNNSDKPISIAASQSKLDRCLATKTFNFDNQHISDINFLDSFTKTKLKEKNLNSLSINVLSIQDNSIKSLPSFFISHITDIKKINCSKNEFSVIPLEIFDFTTLKTLNFSCNRIEVLHLNIYKLTNLKELILNNNNIQHLPQSIAELKDLQVVDLSYNNFKIFVKEFITLSTHTLILNNNQINNWELSDHYHWKDNDKLVNLDLSYNKLHNVSEELLKKSNIALLNLKGNNISYYDLKAVDGFDCLMERRKQAKDQGFQHNLNVKFDVCGLDI